jgi:hypothetical protein
MQRSKLSATGRKACAMLEALGEALALGAISTGQR